MLVSPAWLLIENDVPGMVDDTYAGPTVPPTVFTVSTITEFAVTAVFDTVAPVAPVAVTIPDEPLAVPIKSTLEL